MNKTFVKMMDELGCDVELTYRKRQRKRRLINERFIDWPGKADDLSISYDAGIPQAPLLAGGTSFGDNLPAIACPGIDNTRDVADVT